VSFNVNLASERLLMVDSARVLHLIDLKSGKSLATKADMTSAIFNKTGQHVIASTYALDNHL